MDETGPAATPSATVGSRLAAARNAANLTLEEVAQRTRVPLRHLAAIEAGSGEGLPALTYASGFVRSFAGAVGLDPNELAREYRLELGALPPTREKIEQYELADPARVPPWWLAIAALIVALIVAGAYALWRGDALFGHGDKSPAEIATEMVPASGGAPSGGGNVPPVAAPRVAGGPVVLTATGPVWLKVSDGDRRLFMGILDPGKSFAVPTNAADPRLRTGRPQALKVTAGGVEQPPLGRPDQILRATSLAPATLGREGAPEQGSGGAAGAPAAPHRLRESRPGAETASPSPAAAPPPAYRPSSTADPAAPPSVRTPGA